MTYRELQIYLKEARNKGLTTIKLNIKKVELVKEYNRLKGQSSNKLDINKDIEEAVEQTGWTLKNVESKNNILAIRLDGKRKVEQSDGNVIRKPETMLKAVYFPGKGWCKRSRKYKNTKYFNNLFSLIKTLPAYTEKWGVS